MLICLHVLHSFGCILKFIGFSMIHVTPWRSWSICYLCNLGYTWFNASAFACVSSVALVPGPLHKVTSTVLQSFNSFLSHGCLVAIVVAWLRHHFFALSNQLSERNFLRSCAVVGRISSDGETSCHLHNIVKSWLLAGFLPWTNVVLGVCWILDFFSLPWS